MSERWLPIAGYEGWYSISNLGRARSETRLVVTRNGQKQIHKGQILKTTPGWNKRPVVHLRQPGHFKTRLVHQLVLETFISPCPSGQEALHWDDDKNNNRLTNLRWGTRSENLHDRVRNGNDPHTKRTECNYGHLFSPENTIIRPEGSRRCRECKRRRGREYWHRKNKQKRATA